ncbi:Spc19-domain-containing protein, partial [Infundibulicybe gibba]
KARESVFAGGSELYRGDIEAICPPNLPDCVMALEDCCEEVCYSYRLLRGGTQDLLRMTKILDNQRVFLLIDEGTVKKYKTDLADEIEPSINELIERAEAGLKTLQKKESILQTKVDNAQSRPLRAAGGKTTSQKLEARRLQMASKQRERLEDEVKALEAEVMALVSAPI